MVGVTGMVRMRNEVLENLNRLKVLNVLRLHSGARFGEMMKGTGLSRAATGKHLRNLTGEGSVSKDLSRRYHITGDGEKRALLLEEIIRERKWLSVISLPDVKLVAKEGYATVTFDGCDENAIRNIYNHFESFVETAKKEGFDIAGTLRFSRKTKDA